MNKSIKCTVLIVLGFGFFLRCSSIQNNSTNTITTDSLVISSKEFSPQFNTMTDPRDSQTYTIVTIGNQTWMAENLRYKTAGSWLNPNNPTEKYGRLYNRKAVLSACPNGWRLPSDSEWNILEMELGMPENLAYQTGWRGEHAHTLKSKTGWADENNGNNSSGFNAFPAGYYDSESFGGLGNSSGFWASDAGFNHLNSNNPSGLWVRFLGAPKQGMNRFYDDNKNALEWGIACRCIKN